MAQYNAVGILMLEILIGYNVQETAPSQSTPQ